MAQTLSTVRLTVTKVNDTGFQSAEQPGVWHNVSKYAKPAPAIPAVGSRVDATVDPRGFVMAIEPVPENGHVTAPSPTSSPPDATATRLAVLNIAARFLATRPDAKSSDVLAVAEKRRGWGGRATAGAMLGSSSYETLAPRPALYRWRSSSIGLSLPSLSLKRQKVHPFV